jgi:hypothetical protein
MRPELAHQFSLDAIVCVVDAKNVGFHLEGTGWASRASQAARQVAVADIVLLNKVDIATKEQLALARSAISSVNYTVPIIETNYCAINPELVLSRRGFDVSQLTSNLQKEILHQNSLTTTCKHASDIYTITLRPASKNTINVNMLNTWLNELVTTNWKQIHRIKGILWVHQEVQSNSKKNVIKKGAFIIHGVHAELHGSFDMTLEDKDFIPALVIIGIGLNEAKIQSTFHSLYTTI